MVKKIHGKISFDTKKNILLWDGRPIRYRVGIMVMNEAEKKALCDFFKKPLDAIERKFKLV